MVPIGATIAVLAILALSARAYNIANRGYAEGKSGRIRSDRSFAFVYRYLQVSTPVFTITSFWLDAAWLLEVHSGLWAICGGISVAAGGYLLFEWARRALGEHYSPCFDSHVPNGFTHHGPYARIRHPIYTANITILIGLFIASGSIWIAANTVILSIYYVRAAIREEQALRSVLPAYAAYQERTGMMLPSFRRGTFTTARVDQGADFSESGEVRSGT